jgi:hypothetical protein
MRHKQLEEMSSRPIQRWTREEIMLLRPVVKSPKPEKNVVHTLIDDTKKTVRFTDNT